LGPRGRRFESSRPDQWSNPIINGCHHWQPYFICGQAFEKSPSGNDSEKAEFEKSREMSLARKWPTMDELRM
jgi:hypothetical protein